LELAKIIYQLLTGVSSKAVEKQLRPISSQEN